MFSCRVSLNNSRPRADSGLIGLQSHVRCTWRRSWAQLPSFTASPLSLFKPQQHPDNMAKLNFYVLWSLRDAPRQFMRYVVRWVERRGFSLDIQSFVFDFFFLSWSAEMQCLGVCSKSNRRCFQVHIPLPLPKQLVIFGFGEWSSKDTTLSAEVVVSEDVQAQNIGTLSHQIKFSERKYKIGGFCGENAQVCSSPPSFSRCLTWEGEWSNDLIRVAAERGRKGVYGKIVLKVCGEVGEP